MKPDAPAMPYIFGPLKHRTHSASTPTACGASHPSSNYSPGPAVKPWWRRCADSKDQKHNSLGALHLLFEAVFFFLLPGVYWQARVIPILPPSTLHRGRTLRKSNPETQDYLGCHLSPSVIHEREIRLQRQMKGWQGTRQSTPEPLCDSLSHALKTLRQSDQAQSEWGLQPAQLWAEHDSYPQCTFIQTEVRANMFGRCGHRGKNICDAGNASPHLRPTQGLPAVILIPKPWMMTGQWLEVAPGRADVGAATGGGELSLHLYAPGCWWQSVGCRETVNSSSCHWVPCGFSVSITG